MTKVRIVVEKVEEIEVPDEVYEILTKEHDTEEDRMKWMDAGNAVAEQIGMDWAYYGTGLRRIETLDGEILAEA